MSVNEDLMKELFDFACEWVFTTNWKEHAATKINGLNRLYGESRITPIAKKVNTKIKRKFKIKRNTYEV